MTEKYKSYSLHNFHLIPQVKDLTEEQQLDIRVVGHVLPFKTNNYVVDELIDWQNVPDDPMFRLTFPQRDMLTPQHFDLMTHALRHKSRPEVTALAHTIRLQLNPHPAGQMELNIPTLGNQKLPGIQHKYRETVLFFPKQGQTCHAYCSYCFRWPQFVGMDDLKFAMKETELLISYLRLHPEVTDVLFTGGDPLIMKAQTLKHHLETLLTADLPHLKTIRLGTKALSFWPHKFLDGPEAEDLLALFRKVVDSGKHLAFMAHFSHPRELSTAAVQEAIGRIRATGVEIRTQAPILKHINDRPENWADMWQEQVKLGCIPYYMFVVRDTGAQPYFGVPLMRAWHIFKDAYQRVSGLARTVRGPSMSATNGKIQIMGPGTINGQKVMILNWLQARDTDLVMRPFFAKYDERALWIDDLVLLDQQPQNYLTETETYLMDNSRPLAA